MKKRLSQFALFVISLTALAFCVAAMRPNSPDTDLAELGSKIEFTDQGELRTYYVARPLDAAKDELLPTVFCFHGGGGNLKGVLPMVVGLRDEGFQVVTPVGLNGHWNDGRITKKHKEQDARIDDTAFVARVLSRTDGIDRKRVYAFGVSNGGMFTHRLGIEKRELFTAVAIIAAPLPVADKTWATREHAIPLPVMFIMGKEDPWLPFTGGQVIANIAPRLLSNDRDWGQGDVHSAEKTIEFWTKKNGAELSVATEEPIADRDPTDGCNAIRKTWEADGKLVLDYIEISGGGHTVPGAIYPEGQAAWLSRVFGNTCMDFKTTEELIGFFKQH